MKIRIFLFAALMLLGGLTCKAQYQAKDLERLLKQYNETTSNSEKAEILYKIGLWYEHDKGYEKEIQYLEQAYQLERKADNEAGQINNLEHMIYAYKQTGLYPDAINHSKDLLKLYRKQNNDNAYNKTLKDLSMLYKLNHNYRQAIETDQELIAIHKTNNDQKALVKTYADLGFLNLELDNASQALKAYDNAQRINQSIAGQTNLQGDLLINMGFIFGRELNLPDRAKDYYRKALVLKQQTNDYSAQALLHNEIGQIDYKSGRKKEAQKDAQKAIALAKNHPGNQKYNTLAKSYQLLADLHAKDNDHKTSAQYYAQYLEVQNVLDSLDSQHLRAQQKKLRKVQAEHKKTRSRLFAKERRRNRMQDQILKQENELKALKIKEKEADIIRKQQLLQQEQLKTAELEKDKVIQLLALAEQKQKTAEQSALAEKQRLLTEKQKLENEKKQEALERAEQERIAIEKEKELQKIKLDAVQKAEKLKAQELQYVKERNRMRDYLFVLFAIVVVLVIMGLVSTVRSRKKLQAKNNLLNEANHEINEQKEEILVQNEELNTRNQQIETERVKSDNLLLNILPFETAQELKDKGSATPRHYKQVSVLFTDFKGFTQLAETLPPEDVITELNHCFTAFDDICKKHNIEKIKTIGDAYMAAGGIPVPNTSNPVDVINAGLEMQAFMTQWKAEKVAQNLPVWELRLGIHTGEIVAGVVGKNKFAYDIWGDTVNLASRMESSGEIGMVNISGSTYELVKDHFKTEYRGKIKAKNKGEIDMYFVKNGK